MRTQFELAAGADQVPLAANLDRVYRQRDYPAGLSPAHFEHIKVAADEADPNERNEGLSEQPFSRAWLEKFWLGSFAASLGIDPIPNSKQATS